MERNEVLRIVEKRGPISHCELCLRIEKIIAPERKMAGFRHLKSIRRSEMSHWSLERKLDRGLRRLVTCRLFELSCMGNIERVHTISGWRWKLVGPQGTLE